MQETVTRILLGQSLKIPEVTKDDRTEDLREWAEHKAWSMKTSVAD